MMCYYVNSPYHKYESLGYCFDMASQCKLDSNKIRHHQVIIWANDIPKFMALDGSYINIAEI